MADANESIPAGESGPAPRGGDQQRQLRAALHQIDKIARANALLERKIALLEREVENANRFACHDELTGLPNRRLLLDRFRQVVARETRQHQKSVLLFLDLDDFKPLNDQLGHAFGDRVLKQVAARLNACIRTSDTACRYGGDEFVVLLPEFGSLEAALSAMVEIRARLALPYRISHSTIAVTASIGAAVYPTDGRELEELIHAADRDMYLDKAHGLHRHGDYSTVDRSSIARGMTSQPESSTRP